MRRFFIAIIFLFLASFNVWSDGEDTIGGVNAAGHIVQDEGTKLRQRPYLNFTGSGVTCIDSGGKTVCTIGGGGSITTIGDCTGPSCLVTGGNITVDTVNGSAVPTDEVGAVTLNKWCIGDGSLVQCTENAPAGTGDITRVGDCLDGECLVTGGNVTTDTVQATGNITADTVSSTSGMTVGGTNVCLENGSNCQVQFSPTDIDTDYGNETVTSTWNFIDNGTGVFGAYDATFGDVTTPDYGAIQIGGAGIYRASFSSANLNLGQAVVIRQETNLDVGNDPGIEFAIMESGNTVRLAIPESAAGNATALLRSVTIAGPYSATIGNDIVTCNQWSAYDSNIDCDTTGTGADLFVQDDLEVEGTIFAHETINLEGATADGNQVIIQVGADPGADVTLTLPTATGILLSNVVEDTTPQLGGNLDGQSNNITGVGALTVTGTTTSNKINLGGGLTAFILNGVSLDGIVGATSTIDTELHYIGLQHSNTAAAGSRFMFGRSKGTFAVPTIVADGNSLMAIDAAGFDGTDYVMAAQIDVEVDGTPGANDMPGRILFKTTADGGILPAERMRISANGNVNIAGLTASELVATDASKNLQSLAVATYPSLAELAYVKGVTSAIQTQLNAKGAITGQVWTGTHDFGGAVLEIPNAAAVTDPAVAGQVAIDTTSDQFLYYGSAQRVMTYRYTDCRTLEAPTNADDDIPMWFFPEARTITDIHCQTEGGTSVAITLSDGTNAMEAVTCDADGADDDGTPTNNTFTANEEIQWDTAAPTGTVAFVTLCITTTITAD